MKVCPCCGYKFNLLNYHLHTRILPEADTNYKSLHCLECNNKIQKEESIFSHYIKIIITFILSILFASFIRFSFDIWMYTDVFIVNIPFIILFYILKYIYDYSFSYLECYDESKINQQVINEQEGNIYGIFGEQEKRITKQSKYVIFWILTIIVALLIGFALNDSIIK